MQIQNDGVFRVCVLCVVLGGKKKNFKKVEQKTEGLKDRKTEDRRTDDRRTGQSEVMHEVFINLLEVGFR